MRTGCRFRKGDWCTELRKECIFDDADTEWVPCPGYKGRDSEGGT